MPTTFRILAVFLLLPWIPASAVHAQEARGYLLSPPNFTLTVWGAHVQPSTASDVFDFTFDELTASRRDFAGPALGAELTQPISARTSLAFSLARSWVRHPSELRDFVDENDLPIRQDTRFSRTALGAALRYHFVAPGRTIGSFAWIPAPVVPWVSAGGGALHYRFEQRGEFVDAGTLAIFEDRFTSAGWTAYAEAGAGIDVTLSPRYALTASGRYLQGSARMRDDFVGFERIDLSGLALTLGLTLRF